MFDQSYSLLIPLMNDTLHNAEALCTLNLLNMKNKDLLHHVNEPKTVFAGF